MYRPPVRHSEFSRWLPFTYDSTVHFIPSYERTQTTRLRPEAAVNDAVPIGLVVLMVCSVFAPSVAAADATQADSVQDRAAVDGPTEHASTQPTSEQQSTAATSLQEVDEVPYDDLSDQLEALASVTPETNVSVNESLNESQRAAARAGAREGAQIVQEQGVDITQAQINATINSSLRAAAQFQNASAEQIQAATTGAAHGALLQSQQVNVTQVQAGVYASAAGAMSQSATVTQVQAAAYGAAHGSVAQHQRANVTQIQFAAVGAAAGAAHANTTDEADAQATTQTQQVNVTQIQEAAQGAAYGSLEQRQTANVTQVQAAAFGAAGGAVESKRGANPKKVQESAMGAAQGALVQVQQVTITQIQAAARGACKGALVQSQNATVAQIQQSSMGAAEGALSQSQGATVVQIQAAALGAASGTITQVQSITVVQVQQAAYGAAAGAVGSAVQYQVTNVRQIQAAATGAASGTVIQIQQINIVQIQVIADSAASGALSQAQNASVVQIQSAARGASEGSLALTQSQTVSIEQIQTSTERAAATTVQTAIEINVTQEVTIYNYAKGTAVDPEADEADGEDDDGDGEDQDRLQSLFASADDETVFLANPNDVAVTVTVTSGAGDLQTVTLASGESTTLELDPGTYTLTAETEDGRDVELAGRSELTISVGDELQSLAATVDNRTLTVENPNDQRVVVTATADDGRQVTFEVPGDWTVEQRLDPGTYTLTAETIEGRSVQINGQSEVEVTLESPEPDEPEAIDLNVSVDNQTLTLENPSNATVTVTVTPDDGEEQTVEVGANATETVSLDPGNYTVTGEAGDREVLVEGESAYNLTIDESDEVEAIDLDVSVDGQNVTVQNPSSIAATVTVSAEGVENRTFDVPANESVTEQFEPGNYTLTGESAEREVLLNGAASLNVTVEELALDRQIDSCGNVTEPGRYELTADLQATGDRSCLWIQSADVTIDGNGFTIEGDGSPANVTLEPGSADAGILVYNEAAGADQVQIDNVTIRDVEATGWNAGVQSDLDLDSIGDVSNVTITDSTFRGNDVGVSLFDWNATLRDVTLADNEYGLRGYEAGSVSVENATIEANTWGVSATEGTNVTLDRSVVQDNSEAGVVASFGGVATVVNSVVAGNDRTGVESDTSGAIYVSNTTVLINGGAGVQVDGGLGATLENVTVSGNGDEGLLLNESATLRNVTVTENSGLAIDATEGSATATALRLGPTLNTTFTDESVALDDVAQESLPGLPEDATALSPGLNASSLDGDIQVQFAVDTGETDGTETANQTDAGQTDTVVQLWRYDGTEWTTVANETESVDGVVTETITEDGIYALVSVPAEADRSVNATVEGVIELFSHRDDRASRIVSTFVVGDRDDKAKAQREEHLRSCVDAASGVGAPEAAVLH